MEHSTGITGLIPIMYGASLNALCHPQRLQACKVCGRWKT